MPAAIHNRAEHILAKNPEMDKSKAFAIATQQMHAIGKTPKGYGTSEGKSVAKAKYPNKRGYVKTPNPGKLESPKMQKSASDDTRKRDAGVGAASLVGGGLIGRSAKEPLTGRETFYHGTRADLVDKVREEGVKPSKQTKVKGVTEMLGGKVKSDSRGLAFIGKDPTLAAQYASQSDTLKDLLSKPVPESFRREAKDIMRLMPQIGHVTPRKAQILHAAASRNHAELAERVALGAKHPGVLTMSVPLWKQKIVDNPEHTSIINTIQSAADEGQAAPLEVWLARKQTDKLYRDSVAASPEGFSSKYIRGSSKYQKLSPQEVLQYARAKPGRFGKGLALGAGALGAAAFGANKLIGALRGPSDDEKTAYAVSEFSGPLGYGPFKQESQIPPFRNPRVKTGGPPSSGKKKQASRVEYSEKDDAFRKEIAPGVFAVQKLPTLKEPWSDYREHVLNPVRSSQTKGALTGLGVGALGGFALGRKVGIPGHAALLGGLVAGNAGSTIGKHVGLRFLSDEGKAAQENLLEYYRAGNEKVGGIRSAVRGVVSKSGEEFARGALKTLGDSSVATAKKHKGKLIGAVVAKGAYDAHRDKRVARNITSELRKYASESGKERALGALGGSVLGGLAGPHTRIPLGRRMVVYPGRGGGSLLGGILGAAAGPSIASRLKEKRAYDPSPLGNVDMPGMSSMQTPAKQLQQSKIVAKIPATKPDAGKAFRTKLPTIGSAV